MASQQIKGPACAQQAHLLHKTRLLGLVHGVAEAAELCEHLRAAQQSQRRGGSWHSVHTSSSSRPPVTAAAQLGEQLRAEEAKWGMQISSGSMRRPAQQAQAAELGEHVRAGQRAQCHSRQLDRVSIIGRQKQQETAQIASGKQTGRQPAHSSSWQLAGSA